MSFYYTFSSCRLTEKQKEKVSKAQHSWTVTSGILLVCYKIKIFPVCFASDLCALGHLLTHSSRAVAHALLPFFLLLSSFVWLISSPRFDLYLKEK